MFNDQDIELDIIMLTNLDSIRVNQIATSDLELSIKKYVDDDLRKNTIPIFNQMLEKIAKVTVGNTLYNINNYNKQPFLDTTIFQNPNTRGYLL